MDEMQPGESTASSLTAEVGDIVGAAQPFVGRWNCLVSTTNWEKGRIIHEWRGASTAADVPPSDCSDDVWARLVGGVTAQHVGRLRRVYQRFGNAYEEFDGLYWSHFFAALDWDDAEMWLEGAVQSRWSVSQMRRSRWETLGGEKAAQPRDEDVIHGELDEDFKPAVNTETIANTIAGAYEQVQGGPTERADVGNNEAANAPRTDSDDDVGAAIFSDDRERESIEFVRPFAELSELPDDLAEAFEAFKLAILRHKAEDWEQISRDEVLASLDALKELAVAPSSDDTPF